MTIRSMTAALTIVLGAVMVLGGIVTWNLVGSTLGDQAITVSDDAPRFAGDAVDGPFTAYTEAQVIDAHTLVITDGQTYAQLDREDPLRVTAMNASFLRSSLFTSVLAFGVSAMAVAGGLMFMLLGVGIADVERRNEMIDITEEAKTRLRV